MKKLIAIVFLFVSAISFAQAPASTFYYKAKFEGVNDAKKAEEVSKTMKTVFKTTANYNESTDVFEWNSKMSINQTAFSHLMTGEGYTVELFEKTEVKAEVPAEVKTTTITAPPVIKDTVTTTSTATAKKPKK